MSKIMTNKQSPMDALTTATKSGNENKRNMKAEPKGGYEPVGYDRGDGAECIRKEKYKDVGKI